MGAGSRPATGEFPRVDTKYVLKYTQGKVPRRADLRCIPMATALHVHDHTLSQDSQYNLDPEAPEMVDDYTAAMLAKEDKELSDLETEIIQAPFVQVCVRH